MGVGWVYKEESVSHRRMVVSRRGHARVATWVVVVSAGLVAPWLGFSVSGRPLAGSGSKAKRRRKRVSSSGLSSGCRCSESDSNVRLHGRGLGPPHGSPCLGCPGGGCVRAVLASPFSVPPSPKPDAREYYTLAYPIDLPCIGWRGGKFNQRSFCV